jgi:hypothetical protein
MHVNAFDSLSGAAIFEFLSEIHHEGTMNVLICGDKLTRLL